VNDDETSASFAVPDTGDPPSVGADDEIADPDELNEVTPISSVLPAPVPAPNVSG